MKWHGDVNDNPDEPGWYWTVTYFINRAYARPVRWTGTKWNETVREWRDGKIDPPEDIELVLARVTRYAND